MTALADGAAAFSATLEVRDVWQRVLNQTIQAMQGETAALGFIEGPEQRLVFRAAAGQNAGNIIERHVEGGPGLVGRVVRDGHRIVIADCLAGSRFTAMHRSSV